MPITFQVYPEAGYFKATFTGAVSGPELRRQFLEFYAGPDWVPGYNELDDIGESNWDGVSQEEVQLTVIEAAQVMAKHQVTEVCVAVYAPHDLPFGLARMYATLAEEGPETLRVFRKFEDAEAWIVSKAPVSRSQS